MQKKSHHPQVLIGTSGWSYVHWKENFYPEGLKPKNWLHFYGDVFSTVEINNTFYHLPLLSSVRNWHAQVPEHFTFSIKASRYITHLKRLHDCKKSLEIFYQCLQPLKSKIGPILFQLPPSLKMNRDVLVEFIACLDPSHKYTFEFRHSSWYTQAIYELLAESKIALCITDLKGTLSPEIITANFTYIRLHGPQKAYSGAYGPSRLKSWQKKIEKWSSETSIYCYFDNDEKGYAIQDALCLQKLIDAG